MKKCGKVCYFIVICAIVCTIIVANHFIQRNSAEPLENPIVTDAGVLTDDTVVDFDGNIYRTVKIGTQVWMVENLRTTTYNDGGPIALVENNTWGNLQTPAYCWMNNDVTNKDSYGALYNWYAVDTDRLAPKGWHVPTKEEWTILIEFVGSSSNAGGLLKEKGSQHWLEPNNGASDAFGFSARGGGYRNFDGLVYNQTRDGGHFWTATEQDSRTAMSFTMNFDSNEVREWAVKKTYGRSIRCIQDNPIIEFSEPINSKDVLSGTSAFDKKYAKWALQDDFKILQSLIESNHPKLYTDEKRLSELYISQYDLIEDGITELQFLRLLSPIVSILNCGHTSIGLSSEYQTKLDTEGKYFPLSLRFIGNRAYIVESGMAKNIPIGSELLSINGQTTQEIIKTLFDNLPADGQNETRKIMLLNGGFRYSYQNFMDDIGVYDITYKTPEGITSTIHLEGATNAELKKTNKPTYLGSSVLYESEFYKKYAVLTLHSFSPHGAYNLDDFKSFIDAFFEQCLQRKIENLILDVRDNGGGDPRVASHLFSYLEKKEQSYFSATSPDFYNGLKDLIPFARNHYDYALYVLMNGGSFSTSGHLLALLKSQNVGVFIGEESGGSYACSDASQDFDLTHTGIQLRSSTLKWEVAAEGLIPGRGIMPDFEVIPTIEDYLNQKDVVKQFAIDKINGIE